METTARPEIAAYADAIATWADRYTPPPELANAELGGFPYLGPHFQFTEKQPGDAPFLADIHCFNHGASLSIGKVAGDIPGISTGAAWLAAGIAAEFYNRDIEAHWQILLDFDKPELFGDEWTDTEGLTAARCRWVSLRATHHWDHRRYGVACSLASSGGEGKPSTGSPDTLSDRLIAALVRGPERHPPAAHIAQPDQLGLHSIGETGVGSGGGGGGALTIIGPYPGTMSPFEYMHWANALSYCCWMRTDRSRCSPCRDRCRR